MNPTPQLIRDMAAAGMLTKHHTASCLGYESRKGDGTVHRYKGRFGSGWKLLSPRHDTTRFVDVTYYVEGEQ